MLDEKNALESRIRERAFHLWQEAGSPEGREDEFWHQAREIEINNTQPRSSEITQDASGGYPPIDDKGNFA